MRKKLGHCVKIEGKIRWSENQLKKWADLLNIEENRFNELNDLIRQICSKWLK